MRRVAVLALLLLSAPAHAETKVVCTAVADAATGAMLREEGECDRRVTPASTFKIPIALMGFDAGFLKSEHDPVLPFREGYPDWIKSWRTDTDPAAWLKNSVVWYSQQITRAIGKEKFERYVAAFGYGNGDVSGKDGLTTAWLSSTLRISPKEQLAFLRKIVRRELPIAPDAYEKTSRLVDFGVRPGGWQVFGKTGAGFPVDDVGKTDRTKPYGWFVGWAVKGERTVVFARLIQDQKRQGSPPGFRARDWVLDTLFGEGGGL